MGDISLLDGALPLVLLAAGGLALVALLARPGRAGVVAVVAAAASTLLSILALNWLLTSVLQELPEDLPVLVVVWISLALGVLVLVVGSLVRTSVWRKVLALVCGVVLVATACSQINLYFAQYPTLGALWGEGEDVAGFTGKPATLASRSETTPVVTRWNPADAGPTSTVVSAPIPGTLSGFVARDAVIYLPPAYTGRRPPRLPVLVLVAGQPGAPGDWLVGGQLAKLLDGFAARHGGLAPVTVVVDPNGSTGSNTMCMDSAIARADTYLSRDVPDWITANLGIDSNHARWVFGGWSFGGTCAVQMATLHADLYPSFIDMAGEREPAITADRNATIQQAFRGDTVAFDALTPLNVLAKQRYPDSWGYFAAGGNEAVTIGWMQQVSTAAKDAGMTVQTKIVPSQGHSWAVPTSVLDPALTWLAPRLGFTAG